MAKRQQPRPVDKTNSIRESRPGRLVALLHSKHGCQPARKGHLQNIHLTVRLRFKIIMNGAKGKMSNADKIRALHVEVNYEDRYAAKKRLQDLYGSDQIPLRNLPLSIRFRLVSPTGDAMNLHAAEKSKRLRMRQANFQKHVLTVISWEVTYLDYRISEDVPVTLCDLIMEIKSSESPTSPLFHTVAQTWNQEGFIFTFIPARETEARTIISPLLPLLKHTADTWEVEKCFTPEAAEKAHGAHWDPHQNCIISKVDDVLDYALTNNLELHLEAPIENAPIAIDRGPLTDLQRDTFNNMDNDSVSTFRTAGPPISTNRALAPTAVPLISGLPTPPLNPVPFQPTGGSINTPNTMGSMESRMSTIETQLTTMASLLATLLQHSALTGDTTVNPATGSNAPGGSLH